VAPGLNLKGQCSNQNCNAYRDKKSWIRKGFGTFEIGKEKSFNLCNGCNKKISGMTVTTMGFYKCHLVVEGIKMENEE
jgi:hypothetical protein